MKDVCSIIKMGDALNVLAGREIRMESVKVLLVVNSIIKIKTINVSVVKKERTLMIFLVSQCKVAIVFPRKEYVLIANKVILYQDTIASPTPSRCQ